MLYLVPDPHPTDPDQYLTRHQVAQLIQVDVRSVDRYRADAVLKFPHPIYLPYGQPRWRRADILAWAHSTPQSLRRNPTA
jgi:predicted DNA-binding transcriptional regulator AlpA